MLDEVLALVADATDTLTETCGPCAGNPPAPGPTGMGAAGSAGSGGGPGGDPGDDREWHEEPGHERRQQRENAQKTAKDLIWEFVTSPSRSLGKVLGPLTVVASGSEALSDGVSTVTDANRRREERIYEQTQGEMGQPPSSDPTGSRSNDPGRGGSDEPSEGDGASDRRGDPHEEAGRQEAERVMENIRIKQQIEDNGYGDDDSWKRWR